jgi:hypothetical protein
MVWSAFLPLAASRARSSPFASASSAFMLRGRSGAAFGSATKPLSSTITPTPCCPPSTYEMSRIVSSLISNI